jgi:hypothetical protein
MDEALLKEAAQRLRERSSLRLAVGNHSGAMRLLLVARQVEEALKDLEAEVACRGQERGCSSA